MIMKTFTVFFSFLLVSVANAGQEPLPNIVLIVADDMGWNQVGYNGTEYYETPSIDRLADEGMRFDEAYSSNPVCSPTRAALMSGKNPARLHITDYIPGASFPYARLNQAEIAPGLPLEEVTLAELAKQQGYVTGHFGKWHLNKDKNYEPGRPKDPESQGFDEVLTTVKPEPDTDPYSDAHHSREITRRSVDFIQRHKDEQFFLYVPHHVVHRPLIEAPELVGKYEAKPGAELDIHNPVMGAMIETMDTGIGEILDTLKTLGLEQNTLVVFVSDNGGLEMLQDQAPFRGGKAMIWQGGIRVPMVIKWPGVVTAGSASDVPVITEDLYVTIAEAMGVASLPPGLDGESLSPVLAGTGTVSRDALYFHYPHYHHLGYLPAGAIVEGNYKLIEWFEPSIMGEPGAFTLYDLESDRGEEHDLAAEHPEEVARLAQKLKDWRADVGASEMSVNPDYDPAQADLRIEN